MGLIKDVLINFNIFQTQQFFRFNGDHQYSNMTGGVFTILIRGILVALLVIKLVSVFNLSTVTATTTTKYELNEVNDTVLAPMNGTSPFLLVIEAIEVTKRLDRTTLLKDTVAWAYNSSMIYTYLEQCTQDHWAAVSADVYKQILDSIVPESILFCLPKTFNHTMSISSDASIEIDFAYRCRSNCSSIPYTKFLVRPILYNRLINSQKSSDYLTSYLDKRRYFGIDTLNYNIDINLNYQIAKYSIQTDHSLLPYQSVTNEQGIQIPNQPTLAYLPNRYLTYVFFRMNFILGNQEYYHFRSFTKILDAISLVGGLIPVFMLVFIWLNYYAMSHFEMTFVKRLHSDQKAKEYGLFYFLSKVFYSILRFFNIDLSNWKETQHYHRMHKTVAHLIDILYLYKRLEFLERALEMILEDHQIKVLHLMRHKTFEEAEEDYQRYQMKVNLQKLIEKRKAKMERSDSLKTSGQYRKEIFLDPHPVATQIMLDHQNSNKNLIVGRELDDVVDREKTKQEETKQRQPEHEEDSDDNDEAHRAQIGQLRQAYRSFERLRREAQDETSSYFSCISKNIYNRLDDADREILSNLNYLLNIQDRDLVMNMVMKELFSKQREQVSIEDSIFQRRSSSSRELLGSRERFAFSSKDLKPYSSLGLRLENLPEKKDEDEDDL